MPFDCRLTQPFNMLVSGPSKSGKTTFISNVMKVMDDMFHNKPKHIILYYANIQPLYNELFESKLINEMINFNDTEPTYEDIFNKVEPYKNDNGSLIIFDDTLSDIKPGFEKVFQVLGHHTNCSLIYIAQNLFYDNKTYRNVTHQLDYIILMRNQRNASQIKTLAGQLCPGNPKYIIESYRAATQVPFSYLFIDCGANSAKELRLRSHIFPHEVPYSVYVEK